ncbi:hypothetical protein Tco_0183756 [Tanacetum coccineum]
MPRPRLLRWVLLLQEFDFKVIDTKGAENLAADHLSRLENPYENVNDPKEINESFPLETLNMVTFRGDSRTPWFAAWSKLPRAMCARIELLSFLFCLPQWDLHPGNHVQTSTANKFFDRFLLPTIYKMPTSLSRTVTRANVKEKLYNVMRCLKNYYPSCEIFDMWGIDFMGPFRFTREQVYSRGSSTICQYGLRLKSKCAPTNDADNMELLHVSPPSYHPQYKWAVDSIKSWFEKESLKGTIGEIRPPGSDKLDDALMGLPHVTKHPSGCAPSSLIARIVKTLSFVIHQEFTHHRSFGHSDNPNLSVDIMEQDLVCRVILHLEERSRVVDINKKTENQAKMTKLSMEWKRLCKNAKVRVNTEESAVKPEPELKNVLLNGNLYP